MNAVTLNSNLKAIQESLQPFQISQPSGLLKQDEPPTQSRDPSPHPVLWTMKPCNDFLREIQHPVSLLRGSALRLGEPLQIQWAEDFPGKEGPSSKPFSTGFHRNVLTTSCEQLWPHLLAEAADLSTPTQYNNSRAITADKHFLSSPQRTKAGGKKIQCPKFCFTNLFLFHFLKKKQKKESSIESFLFLLFCNAQVLLT